MFHVLAQGSEPKDAKGNSYLSAGYEGRAISSVLCGAGVGMRREAVDYDKVTHYDNEGKLRKERICRACASKMGIRIPRKEKEDVTS